MIHKSTDVKAKYLSGGQWKSSKIKQQTKQTEGSKKGDSCKLVNKSLHKGYFGKKGRSYKDPDYARYCRLIDALNSNRQV